MSTTKFKNANIWNWAPPIGMKVYLVWSCEDPGFPLCDYFLMGPALALCVNTVRVGVKQRIFIHRGRIRIKIGSGIIVKGQSREIGIRKNGCFTLGSHWLCNILVRCNKEYLWYTLCTCMPCMLCNSFWFMYSQKT